MPRAKYTRVCTNPDTVTVLGVQYYKVYVKLRLFTGKYKHVYLLRARQVISGRAIKQRTAVVLPVGYMLPGFTDPADEDSKHIFLMESAWRELPNQLLK